MRPYAATRRLLVLTRRIVSFAVLAGALLAGPLTADWNTGVEAFRAGEWATAETVFEAVIQEQPEWPGGHRMLGQTLIRSGRSTEALAHLRRACELAPDDLDAVLDLGQTYLLLGRFADALRLLEDHDPGALPAPRRLAFYTTRGIAAGKLEEGSAKALHDFEQAIRLAPDDAELRYKYGATAKSAGRLELASAAPAECRAC